MTMDIKMLKAIADGALQMAAAMQAVVDDCAEQLAKRKAAGEAEDAIWQEPFAQVNQKAGSRQEASQGAQGASSADESNTSTPSAQMQAVSTPPASNEPKLTIVELRVFVAEKSTPENRPIIKEILTQHGVKKLTELKEEQYRSVLEAVRKACP